MKITQRYQKQQFKGQTFKMKSVTIPGQSYTPQEIVRRYVQQKPNNEAYLEQDISGFEKMDKMAKIDAVKALKTTQQQLSERANEITETIKKTKQIKSEQLAKEKLTKEIKDSLKNEKRDE